MPADERSSPESSQAQKAPAGVVKRNERELRDYVGGEEGFITTLCRFEDEPIVLEPFQRGFLRNPSRFRWVIKSRQVGFSFVTVLEALARCHLRESHTTLFISFALDESKDRVLLARQIYEDLPQQYKKKLVIDSKTELGFESNSARGKISRIISVPSKAPRGKRGDAVLDELAHYVNDREVYTGSTAVIMRSKGQLTGCSTPLGRRGIFWEVATEEVRKYGNYSRQWVPWWLCRFFCTDVPAAMEAAPELPTPEAVERFGTPMLIEQFQSLALEDFEQEFCCKFVDESYSWFPYELILPCTNEDIHLYEEPSSLRRPEGRLVAGYDVGRHRDRSELALFDEVDGRFTCLMLRTFTAVPFAEQEAELRRLLDVLPIARLSIDRSGIGMNLAENLVRDYPQVVGENFTSESKERWATDFKILLQRREVVLPRHRELVSQIHSIKRRVLPSGKVSFDAERTDRSHADKFWAVALACQKERAAARHSGSIVTVRVLGPSPPVPDRFEEARRKRVEASAAPRALRSEHRYQTVAVGIAAPTLIRELKQVLGKAFPALEALTREEALEREEAEMPPIVFSYAFRNFVPDFPVYLEFARFPGTGEHPVEVGISLAKLFHESSGVRTIADAGPLTPDGAAHRSIVWDKGRSYLADDEGSHFSIGSGGMRVSVMGLVELPHMVLDERGTLLGDVPS